MNKCFAYREWTDMHGYKTCNCDILNRTAFRQVQRMYGGCCMRNCRFYKEDADMVRSDWGISFMTERQKNIRNRYRQKMGE